MIEEFEKWYLSLDCDFTEYELHKRSNGEYFFTTTRALYNQFVELAKSEERLLNAFQLVKNGVSKGYLKFDEFKELMDKEHDRTGKIV